MEWDWGLERKIWSNESLLYVETIEITSQNLLIAVVALSIIRPADLN